MHQSGGGVGLKPYAARAVEVPAVAHVDVQHGAVLELQRKTNVVCELYVMLAPSPGRSTEGSMTLSSKARAASCLATPGSSYA